MTENKAIGPPFTGAMDAESTVPRRSVPAVIALSLLAGAMFVSVVGTLLLKGFPSFNAALGPYYVHLVSWPTWLYMTMLPVLVAVMYGHLLGRGRLLRYVVVGAGIGGLSEVIGTMTGFPFGQYTYTMWLGPKFLGHVPYFIPLSWFAVATLSHDLSARLVGTRTGRILTTALLMVLWDVSLDPAMSRAFPFWVYPDGGFFFGMPLSNWAGWFAVSALIAAGFEWWAPGPAPRHPWSLMVWTLNALFPAVLSLLYDLPAAAAIGASAALLPALWFRCTRQP